MDKIKIKNIFTAVFDKSILDPLFAVLDKKSVWFWGTEGTVKYLKSKGFSAHSVVRGFDFDGKVKSMDRKIFARILADRTKKKHMAELRVIARTPSTTLRTTKQSQKRSFLSRFARDRDDRETEPFDLVVVDLYAPDPKNFPESMDIGGQALIRAAVKNYKKVALVFDRHSLASLLNEMISTSGSTSLAFRRGQASKALKFIAERCKLEAKFKL